MVKHLIGFVGTSEAGKSSLSNYLHGTVLGKLHDNEGKPAITNWRLNEHGKLEIETDNYSPEDDKWESAFSELDVDNRSADFQMWARGSLWTYIKSFYLSWPLKRACKDLLGLNYNQIYGTGKKTETNYRWKDFLGLLNIDELGILSPDSLKANDYMSAREIMEIFGTKVIRSIDPDIYPKRLVEQLQKEHSHIGVITDIRRLNEAKILKENGCVLIRLLRGNPVNISEVDIDEIVPDFSIDNRTLTLQESCLELDKIVEILGLFKKRVE